MSGLATARRGGRRAGRRRRHLGVYAVRVASWRPLPLVGAPPRTATPRLAGVVHVHTTLSDGGGTPEEVIAAARAAGLEFVAITDHNNLDAKPLEGYRDGVLVLVGSELSTPAGHVLGLGLDRDPPFRFNGDARDAARGRARPRRRRLRGAPVLGPRATCAGPAWDAAGPVGDRAPERRQRVAAGRVCGCCSPSASTSSTRATRCCRA